VEAILLGTGSSAGTPVIGCACATCTSSDPKNNRLRSSIAVFGDDGTSIVIDTGPDFRQQMLKARIIRLDGVLYTHTHADHLNGIDDLRAFCFIHRHAIPIYGNVETLNEIQSRFQYAFLPPSGYWERPVLTAKLVSKPFNIGSLSITPIPVWHGKQRILGWRINQMAYLTDVSEIPESSLALLENLDCLFLDCLRERPHPTHLHLDMALSYAAKINAKKAVLIHMTHELEYGWLMKQIPPSIVVGYDMMHLRFYA